MANTTSTRVDKSLTDDIIEQLLKEVDNIEAAVQLMAPVETGNLRDHIKVSARRTATGVRYIISGYEYLYPRTIINKYGQSRTIKPRNYLWGDGSTSYVGPMALDLEPGQTKQLKNGGVLQSFILEPIDEAIKRVVRVITAKYNMIASGLDIEVTRGN